MGDQSDPQQTSSAELPHTETTAVMSPSSPCTDVVIQTAAAADLTASMLSTETSSAEQPHTDATGLISPPSPSIDVVIQSTTAADLTASMLSSEPTTSMLAEDDTTDTSFQTPDTSAVMLFGFSEPNSPVPPPHPVDATFLTVRGEY